MNSTVKGLNLGLKQHLVDGAPAMRGPARGEDTRGSASGALSNVVDEVVLPGDVRAIAACSQVQQAQARRG
jgi:hypothetical protein